MAGWETHATRKDANPEFFWIKAPNYSGNGLARLLNMITFGLKCVALPYVAVVTRKNRKPSLVWGSSPSLFAGVSAWALSKLLHTPFVLEIRDIYPQSIVALGRASSRHPFIRALRSIEKFLYRRANLIISPLKHVDVHVESSIGRSRPFIWVPNYADLSQRPEPTPAAESPDPFVIVYTGTLGLANEMSVAVEALALLQEDGVELHLYGAGVALPALKRQAESLGLGNIRFMEPLPKPQIYQVQSRADALLIIVKDSPLYEFGLSPNKLYDYLASGSPTIYVCAASYDPVAEVGAGISVPSVTPQALAEAVRELKQMPARARTEMGRRGRALVSQEYDVTIVARRLADALPDITRDPDQASTEQSAGHKGA